MAILVDEPNATITDSELYKFKARITRKTTNAGNTKMLK